MDFATYFMKRLKKMLWKRPTERSLLSSAIKGQKKRDIKFKVKNTIYYDKSGVITRVESVEENRIGLTDEQRKEYAIERRHMYHSQDHAKTLDAKKAEMVSNTETASLLVLKDVTLVDKKSLKNVNTLGIFQKTDIRVDH